MTKLFSILLSIGLLFGVAGCKTTDGDQSQKVAVVAKLAGYDGTYLYLLDNPNDKAVFESVVTQLDALLKNGLTLEGFLWTVKQLPIKELQSDKGVVIVDSAIILFGAFSGELVKLDQLEQNERLYPVAVALRDGIKMALERIN